MPASELAARTCVTKQTITSLLDGLEKDGYIERIADGNDRRVTLIRLRSEGMRLMDQLMPKVFEAHKQAMTALTADEQRQLATLLRIFPDLPLDTAWASGASDQRIFILRRHRLTVAVNNETDHPMDLGALNRLIAAAITAWA